MVSYNGLQREMDETISEKSAVVGNVKNVRLTGAEGARSLDKSDCRGEFTRRRDIFCKNTSRSPSFIRRASDELKFLCRLGSLPVIIIVLAGRLNCIPG